MVTIGNDSLPGLITTLDSAATTGANIGAPGVPVILGQAYLDEGSGSAASAERITRPKRAQTLFGPDEKSKLTKEVQSALVEGAYPVYAIAADETTVTAEDLSGVSSTSGTLANAPVQEVAEDITFTVNSTDKTTVLYYEGDPTNASPGTDEVYLNPVTGQFEADESLGAAGDEVDYTYLDYSNAFTEITEAQFGDDVFLREVVDFVGTISENDTVVDALSSKVSSMEGNGWFSIGIAGAGDPYIADTSSYTDSYDTSRLQLIYPSRNADGDSLIGSYLGLRARIGIDSSPIFKRFRTSDRLLENLTQNQKTNLVSSNIIPIDEESGGSKVVEDITTVSDDNVEEAAWDYGSARLITDFVAETIEEISQPYIGQFNNTGVQNSLRANIADALNALLGTQAIEAYSIIVEEQDATTVTVDVGINTADPLRNIDLTVSAGQVANGVTVEAN